MTEGSNFAAAVIGGGAVGCAVARELCLRGISCVVLEKNADVLGEASAGNTGHLATNFYYGEGDGRSAPLESKLTRRAAEMAPTWLAQQPNVPRKKCGMLFVASESGEIIHLRKLLQAGQRNGVQGLRELTKEEVLAREPSLNANAVVGGIVSEEEHVVDSFLLALSNLYEALQRGCILKRSCEVKQAEFEDETNRWKLSCQEDITITANYVLNCAGNFSDTMHSRLTGDDEDAFSIRPAKGQYEVIEMPPSSSGFDVNSMVVAPPGEKSAGFYVFRAVYGGHLVVGPTHKVQESKTDRTVTTESSKNLLSHGRQLFPNAFPTVEDGRARLSFCGLRPGCQFKDYQIKVDEQRRFATAGAIRSTGLTASRAIAEHICGQLLGPLDEAKQDERDSVPMPSPEPMPGGVIRVGEYSFRVTHPLSQLGIFGKTFT